MSTVGGGVSEYSGGGVSEYSGGWGEGVQWGAG